MLRFLFALPALSVQAAEKKGLTFTRRQVYTSTDAPTAASIPRSPSDQFQGRLRHRGENVTRAAQREDAQGRQCTLEALSRSQARGGEGAGGGIMQKLTVYPLSEVAGLEGSL